ncbi:RIKEN cDNA 5730577I03, partial [Mus musculus]
IDSIFRRFYMFYKGSSAYQMYTIKAFECKICGKVSGYSLSLNSHLQTHTGEKHYECKICKKFFTTSSSLTEHFKLERNPINVRNMETLLLSTQDFLHVYKHIRERSLVYASYVGDPS